MDEAAEPGRMLAARSRLQQSLIRAERAVGAAQKGLVFHRAARFVHGGTGARAAPAMVVQRGGAGDAGPAREGLHAPAMANAGPEHGKADREARRTAAVAAAARQTKAGPGGDRMHPRGDRQAQAAGPQPALLVASGQGQHPAAGSLRRVKLTWHSQTARPATERQAAPASPAGLVAAATTPARGTRESGGASRGPAVEGSRQERHNFWPRPHLSGAAPTGGVQGGGPLRQARSAIAQAGAARIAPRLLDEKAAALRPPTGPVVTKSMAPTGLADRVATTAPPPSAARPDASGHTGVPMGRQAAATGAGTTDDAAAGATTGDRQGPAQGDVYLDGTLMGRWMSRTLAAEAGRPANGSAGFDPRRNVFPTGAMIGG